jgi:hypothetical protein
MSNPTTVNVTHVDGAVIEGRLCMVSEAVCPICGKTNRYRHVDSHYTIGRWYGCKDLFAFNWDESGLVETVEFLEDHQVTLQAEKIRAEKRITEIGDLLACGDQLANVADDLRREREELEEQIYWGVR